MSDDEVTMASLMGQLWDGHRREEFERVHVLERAVAALTAGTLDDTARRAAEDEAHRLAGSLGALGSEAGVSSARELERRFVRPAPREAAELSELVGSLRIALESAGPGEAQR